MTSRVVNIPLPLSIIYEGISLSVYDKVNASFLTRCRETIKDAVASHLPGLVFKGELGGKVYTLQVTRGGVSGARLLTFYTHALRRGHSPLDAKNQLLKSLIIEPYLQNYRVAAAIVAAPARCNETCMIGDIAEGGLLLKRKQSKDGSDVVQIFHSKGNEMLGQGSNNQIWPIVQETIKESKADGTLLLQSKISILRLQHPGIVAGSDAAVWRRIVDLMGHQLPAGFQKPPKAFFKGGSIVTYYNQGDLYNLTQDRFKTTTTMDLSLVAEQLQLMKNPMLCLPELEKYGVLNLDIKQENVFCKSIEGNQRFSGVLADFDDLWIFPDLYHLSSTEAAKLLETGRWAENRPSFTINPQTITFAELTTVRNLLQFVVNELQEIAKGHLLDGDSRFYSNYSSLKKEVVKTQVLQMGFAVLATLCPIHENDEQKIVITESKKVGRQSFFFLSEINFLELEIQLNLTLKEFPELIKRLNTFFQGTLQKNPDLRFSVEETITAYEEILEWVTKALAEQE